MTHPRPAVARPGMPPNPDDAAPEQPGEGAVDAQAADAALARKRGPLATRHYVWIAATVLVVAAALHWLGSVLTPFLFGAILAFLGTPIVDALERRRVRRALATLLVILLFGVVIAAVFLVLIPLVQTEVSLVARRLPVVVERAVDQFVPWVEERFGLQITLDIETLKVVLGSNLESVRSFGGQVLHGVKAGGVFLLALLVNLVLIPVVMFYLLRDWNMILDRLDDLVPWRWRASARTIAGEIHEVLAEFLHGQLLVMLALAAYYSIALYLAGLERALAIGMLTGLLVFVPYVGFGLGFTLGVTAALLQWSGWPAFLAILAVYGIGQLLESYVLIPYLVGDRIGLHPLAVIFALLAFGELFGIAGVLLALPLAAALLVGLRHLREVYAESALYR